MWETFRWIEGLHAIRANSPNELQEAEDKFYIWCVQIKI